MLAVEVVGLNKKFALYQRASDRLREYLSFGKKTLHHELWALKDISFQVGKGKTLGIVGSNGAGKSTLLKILAGLMQPSSGSIRCEGRIATLFDLGMGFHPEFNGRENIYMNAALLGLSKSDIDERFDEILRFSELGSFIDQPVKIYSTGMFLRLGFSVVTVLEPDVLMIDEVLAVGDQHFQKKCVDKILQFKSRGKTIIFCSHNTWQLGHICEQVIWIEHGEMRAIGGAKEVIDAYVDYQRSLDVAESPQQEVPTAGSPDASARYKGHPMLRAIRVCDADGNEITEIDHGDLLRVDVEFEVFDPAFAPILAVVIVRNDGQAAYGISTEVDGFPPFRDPGVQSKSLLFPRLKLLSGVYTLTVFLLDTPGLHVYQVADKVCPFVVRHDTKEVGVCYLDHTWKL